MQLMDWGHLSVIIDLELGKSLSYSSLSTYCDCIFFFLTVNFVVSITALPFHVQAGIRSCVKLSYPFISIFFSVIITLLPFQVGTFLCYVISL